MKLKLLAFFVYLTAFNLLAQGNLAPSSGPTATMKSLDQIEPRTLITNMPYNITKPGGYYLATNFTLNGTSFGVMISANNVELDLGGNVLSGTNFATTGIILNGALTNVALRHGTVTGWTGNGIDASAIKTLNLTLDNIAATDNGSYGIYVLATNSSMSHCVAINNTSSGFKNQGGVLVDCLSSTNGGNGFEMAFSTMTRCIALNNRLSGFFGGRATLTECQANYNGFEGISSVTGTIRDCLVYGNADDGIISFDSVIKNCSAQSDGGYGINVGGCVVSECEVFNNTLSGINVMNTGSKIIGNNCHQNNTGNSATHAGIFVGGGSKNLIENNHVTDNGSSGYGIYIGSGTSFNIITKNVVSGNTTNNYFVGAGSNNNLGPVGTVTNAVSPWANISN